MTSVSTERRTITAAQRGQIIQLVLVEGWTPGRAAAAFAIEERLVAAWLAAYRRDGMASLRHNPSPTLMGEAAGRWLWRPLASLWRALVAARRERPAEPSPLRSSQDGRHGG
jgi:transposase-like protein